MISKYRLFFLIFIPAALSLIIGMALVQQKNKELSEAQFEKQLKNQWLLTSVIADDQNHYEELAAISLKSHLRLTVVDVTGDVLFDSTTSNTLENHKDREEIRSALSGTPAMSLRYSYTTDSHTIYYAEKLPNGHVLRVAYPAEYYNEQNAALMNQAAVGLFILIVAIALFAFLASRKLNSMLMSLSQAVKDAQDGSQDLPSFDNDDLDNALYSLSSATRELKYYSHENSQLNQRLEYILANINEGVLLIANETILYHNRRAEEILDYKIPSDIKSIEKQEIINVFESFIQGEIGDLKLNGKTVNVDMAISGPSRLVMLHDITDQEKYSGYKSDLVGNISHELKTPLTLIMAAAEVIVKDGEMPRNFLDKFLNTIYKNTQRVNLLLDNLIFLHQLEGAKSAEPDEMSIDEVVNDLKDLMGAPAKTINYNVASGQVRIHGTHFISLLTNLINNALKYSQGDRIEVEIKKNGSVVEIRVSDLGPVIAPTERERIFERFYSLSKSRNREKSGSGLGLSIVKHIARLYNGQAFVEENEQGGNTFVVRLVERA